MINVIKKSCDKSCMTALAKNNDPRSHFAHGKKISEGGTRKKK